jgi:hypothetical protein
MESARTNYGVVLDSAGRVDVQSTVAERTSMRRRRLGALPGEREESSTLPSALSARICERCGERAASRGLRIRERPMQELGPVYTTGELTMLRELICGACGALRDAQVSKRGDDVIADHVGA